VLQHIKAGSTDIAVPDTFLEQLDIQRWKEWLRQYFGAETGLEGPQQDASVTTDSIASNPLQYIGGYTEASRRLYLFLKERFLDYYTQRNDPGFDIRSGLSPYLHFGQISPLEIIQKVKEYRGPKKAEEAFIEQLFIRRELSVNYVYYNKEYGSYRGLPRWALKTLEEHASDNRPYEYTTEQLEEAQTHDPYWNAAMKEMMLTGSMHSYMRMYWGKKIIEWSETPHHAFDTMLLLNNTYFLDGRDPNSYAGVAWCFGGHDRPWKEREIFGKVRYMNRNGLERKFDMDAYLSRIEQLEKNG
jgi:deoxyribodipyrimidine photo-lyase